MSIESISNTIEGYHTVVIGDETVSIAEVPGVTGDKSSRTVVYRVLGTQNEQTVIDAALAFAPDWRGFPLQGFGRFTNEGYNQFTVSIVYSADEIDDKALSAGEWLFAWDMSVQNVKVRSAATVAAYGETTDKDYHEGFVNVQSEGRVDGLDIQAKTTGFTISYKLASNKATADAFKLYSDRQLDIHREGSPPFLGIFDAESVQFLQASGTMALNRDQTIALKFVVSPNLDEPFDVGGVTISSGKKGFDYLWAEYEPRDVADDAGEKRELPRVRTVFIARPYEGRSDLNDLLIV